MGELVFGIAGIEEFGSAAWSVDPLHDDPLDDCKWKALTPCSCDRDKAVFAEEGEDVKSCRYI
jgi:hypothetical protein